MASLRRFVPHDLARPGTSRWAAPPCIGRSLCDVTRGIVTHRPRCIASSRLVATHCLGLLWHAARGGAGLHRKAAVRCGEMHCTHRHHQGRPGLQCHVAPRGSRLGPPGHALQLGGTGPGLGRSGLSRLLWLALHAGCRDPGVPPAQVVHAGTGHPRTAPPRGSGPAGTGLSLASTLVRSRAPACPGETRFVARYREIRTATARDVAMLWRKMSICAAPDGACVHRYVWHCRPAGISCSSRNEPVRTVIHSVLAAQSPAGTGSGPS